MNEKQKLREKFRKIVQNPTHLTPKGWRDTYEQCAIICIEHYRSKLKGARKLDKAQTVYAKFLGEHLGGLESFMSNRGGYSPDKKAIAKGKILRARIDKLKGDGN